MPWNLAARNEGAHHASAAGNDLIWRIHGRRTKNQSRTHERSAGTRNSSLTLFRSARWLQQHQFFRGNTMSMLLCGAGRCRDRADECRAIAALYAPSTEDFSAICRWRSIAGLWRKQGSWACLPMGVSHFGWSGRTDGVSPTPRTVRRQDLRAAAELPPHRGASGSFPS
jgi:hypothetical protein